MLSIVVEYSVSQKAFHRHTIAEMLSKNRENMMERRQTDYLPIGLFQTMEDADQFIKISSNMIKNYQLYQNTDGCLVAGPF